MNCYGSKRAKLSAFDRLVQAALDDLTPMYRKVGLSVLGVRQQLVRSLWTLRSRIPRHQTLARSHAREVIDLVTYQRVYAALRRLEREGLAEHYAPIATLDGPRLVQRWRRTA